jgi:hypothetical protein
MADRPCRTAAKDAEQIVSTQTLVRATLADAGRNVAIERLDQRDQRVVQIGAAQT